MALALYYGVIGSLIAFGCGLALLSPPQHPLANATALVLGCLVFLEGALLTANWRGATNMIRSLLRERFRVSPIAGTTLWELRIIGGASFVGFGLILIIAAGSRL